MVQKDRPDHGVRGARADMVVRDEYMAPVGPVERAMTARPATLDCFSCVDRWYFLLVMALEAPKAYLEATKAKELAQLTIDPRFARVRAAGGLR